MPLAQSFCKSSTAQKIDFFSKGFFGTCDQNPQFSADLITFTEFTLFCFKDD